MEYTTCIKEYLHSMPYTEMIAVITGVLSVWYAKKENILVYPVGIISVLLYVYICLHVKLYADAVINFYYFIVSVYGWYYWKKGGNAQPIKNDFTAESVEIDRIYIDQEPIKKETSEAEISYNNVSENIFCIVITIVLAIFLIYILKTYTDSDVPYWDGITTAIFMVAMWLMAKKKIENWILWIVGDAICIPLFIYKGLCLSSLQFLVFTIIAIAGFWAWYKKLYLTIQTTNKS